MYTATVIIRGTVINSHGSVSGQRILVTWLMHCCLVLIVFAVSSSPYFILNTLEFGHPLKTGYEFWVPALADKQLFFLSQCASPACHDLVGNYCQLESISSRESLRHRNLLSPGFHCLSVLGLAFVRVRRFEVSAFLAGIVYSIVTLTYAFVEGRFYLPIFFLLISVAVLPAEWAVEALELHFSISALEC